MALVAVRQANDDPTSLQILFSDPRLALQEDCIVCLICGARFRQLTNTHLRAHGTGVAEYRARFGYNRRRALMCRALRRLYTERAVRAGLAARIRHRPIVDPRASRRRKPARAEAQSCRKVEVLSRAPASGADRHNVASRRAASNRAARRPMLGGPSPVHSQAECTALRDPGLRPPGAGLRRRRAGNPDVNVTTARRWTRRRPFGARASRRASGTIDLVVERSAQAASAAWRDTLSSARAREDGHGRESADPG